MCRGLRMHVWHAYSGTLSGSRTVMFELCSECFRDQHILCFQALLEQKFFVAIKWLSSLCHATTNPARLSTPLCSPRFQPTSRPGTMITITSLQAVAP